jgi:AraC family transcriptional regulator
MVAALINEGMEFLNSFSPMDPTVPTLGARSPRADFPSRVKDQNHLTISDWLEPGRTSHATIERRWIRLLEHFDSQTPAVLLQLLRSAVDIIDADHEVARSYIDRAVVLLEREVSLQRQTRPQPASRKGRNTLAQWQVNRVSDYLEKNLNGPIQIRDLAALTRLTESYFSRAFKGSFGMAPQAYIIKRRMGIAQRLMLTTDESLCQIALACGLSDQAHFSKVFARMFGVPPGVWRRDRRGCLARS